MRIAMAFALSGALMLSNAYHSGITVNDVLIWAAIAIGYAGYGLFLLIMWLLPIVLTGVAVLAGMWFLRKLVLDAVKEARRDPAQRQ